MSWFDTSGIANIAKTALKEAQRTIDKALDIKVDEESLPAPANTPIDTNSDDFFGTWGISQSGTTARSGEGVVTRSPTKTGKPAASIWGSFTGSFFEPYGKESYRKQPRDSVDSLDDSGDLGAEHFSGSKLVVQTHDDSDAGFSRLSSCEADEDCKTDNGDASQGEGSLTVKRRERPSAAYNNRLSVISTESDRKSSESVEILSGSTGCTTSPDSEAISVSSSALDSKPTSESVEILPSTLTSPSSVEVIASEEISNRRCSQHTDEFVSPLQSPDENFCYSEKMTPDSVEVIPDDVDESSIADDTMSYNSLSESTAATVLDTYNLQFKQKPLATIKSETMCESLCDSASISPDKPEVPITRAPSRTGMHLPLLTTLIDTQPQSTKQDLTNLTKTSNVIDIPQDCDSKSNEADDGSDKTLVASDSVMESSSDTSTTTDSNTNSLYLKNMLADAMTEKRDKQEHFMDLTQSMIDSSQTGSSEMLENISITQLDMPPRETSPISSESRSDLVKIGSDHTSAHTSGDELETTTSSDIEIISSPNGDSSSTHSRHSPAKLTHAKCKGDTNIENLLGKMTFKNIKGHNRELSEASSVSDDTEIERLVKRLSEMTEILESRESKLIEISRKHSELQEVNNDLRRQLDVVINKQLETADMTQVTEEYTQRLSALERKFQQAIREKDTLRKQLEACKVENAARFSKSEFDNLLEEKDQTIRELREEGEKLSKLQLQHSNIIKKLRAREKELETTIKHLKESVEDLSSETDRLKRSLTAKEEVERSQIEAVHQLTARNKKIEYELGQLQESNDDLTQRHETVKRSLEAAKKELVDKSRASSELMQREQMLQSLENEKRMTESQNEEIIGQLEDLRLKIGETDREALRKEQALRSENAELLRRLEDAESRNEELSQSLLEVSKPLVRQLEALQATHNMKLASFEKAEQGLMLKISEQQSKLQGALEAEKVAREECSGLRSNLSEVESQIDSYRHENELLKIKIEQRKSEKMLLEQRLRKEVELLQEKMAVENNTVESLQNEIEALQKSLQTSMEIEKKRNLAVQEQIKEKQEAYPRTSSPTTGGNISPALSIGRVSLSESLNSSLWPSDEPFEVNPITRCTNILEMQMLQTNLKQRDGDIQQLQWELNRREHERTLLNSEISDLLTRVEDLEMRSKALGDTQKELGELQQRYETLCQLYGEKVEETEELKLDLVDIKEMYKAQIDELLLQQRGGS